MYGWQRGGSGHDREVVLGGGVTSLHMLIGDSADGQNTCICTRVSRANVRGAAVGKHRQNRSCARGMGHELAHVNR